MDMTNLMSCHEERQGTEVTHCSSSMEERLPWLWSSKLANQETGNPFLQITSYSKQDCNEKRLSQMINVNTC